MTLATESRVSSDQISQYHEEGYFIMKNVLPAEHLQLLRDEAQFSIDRIDAEMNKKGVDSIGISHRGKRYFSANVYKDRPQLKRFLFSDLMADVCRATLGPEAYLFYEQYVIKFADAQSKFSWHQDSGYVTDPAHKPYLTCWITLDDVDERNGTVYVLPQSVSGIRTWVKHEQDPKLNDMVGYFGKEKGVPVNAPAGSIAVFSSLTFHRSGANLSNNRRRIYLAQYSPEIVLNEKKELWANAEPFLKDGVNVAEISE